LSSFDEHREPFDLLADWRNPTGTKKNVFNIYLRKTLDIDMQDFVGRNEERKRRKRRKKRKLRRLEPGDRETIQYVSKVII